MRVIAGRFRRRLLKTLPGLEVRPTPDRLRETLFNVIAPQVEGALFIDAYAGTGAVGIEALSRGARRAIFIEKNRGALVVLRENLKSLGVERESEVIAKPVLKALGRAPEADIFFLDPPYPLEREYHACLTTLGEAPPALVIVQHATRFELQTNWGALERTRMIRQGDNALTLFKRNLVEM
jgi:16S rRNA (guanine(966)-N(2))-methyltransferase RsmD